MKKLLPSLKQYFVRIISLVMLALLAGSALAKVRADAVNRPAYSGRR
jgi:hypothetical protein